MNIEKLAKRLREFTLDKIEMIAETDLETELEQLLNVGKITFEQGRYKYIEKIEITRQWRTPSALSTKNMSRLIVDNLGPIKHVKVDFKKVSVLIGPTIYKLY